MCISKHLHHKIEHIPKFPSWKHTKAACEARCVRTPEHWPTLGWSACLKGASEKVRGGGRERWMSRNEREMLWLGLVRSACQSGEQNTRGRLKLSGETWPSHSSSHRWSRENSLVFLTLSYGHTKVPRQHMQPGGQRGLKANEDNFSHTNRTTWQT